MFDLKFDEGRGGDQTAFGTITIADFSETFEARLDVWSRDDYRASWRRTAARLAHEGAGRFLTSVGPPGAIYFSWPCWRRGDGVVLINALILGDDSCLLQTPDGAELLSKNLPENPDVSIWRCSLHDVMAFKARLHGAARGSN